MWSDLVKVDQDKKYKGDKNRRPEAFIEEAVCNSFPVLPLEIEITCPKVVVFFTGWHYDQRLMQTFNGLKFEKILGDDGEFLSRVIHNGLPRDSFRTYHPTYLSFSKELDNVINKITELAEN